MGFRLRAVLGALLLLVGSSAWAAELVGSSDRLRMMQKIQGKWQDRCISYTKSPSELFKFNQIALDYTHILVKTEIYQDSRCLKPIRTVTQKYRYTIGAPVKTLHGKTAYELNLQLLEMKGKAKSWHQMNLIYFADGQLVFGLDLPEQSGEITRLQKLDTRNPFKR